VDPGLSGRETVIAFNVESEFFLNAFEKNQ
jgi:hypothetical protein